MSVTRPIAWRRGAFLLACALAPLAAPAQGLRFLQAYEAARAYDPGYRAAAYQRDALLEGQQIARGNLLPQVGLVASASSSEGWRHFANSLNQKVELPLDYSSPQVTLSVRWPLIHLEGLAAVDQAKAQAELAEQQFRADGLNLVDRLGMAYMELLAARETHRLASLQVEAAEVVAAQAVRREADGEGTRVLTARDTASLELARSRVRDALTQLEISREGVRRLTGLNAFVDPDLPPDLLPGPLFPADFDEWMDLALRSNPLLRAREWAVEAAAAQVRRDRAGHAPRLDLVGSVTQSRNDALSTIGQSSHLRTLGLQLQVPLFSGGTVSATVRQSQARFHVAEEELRREHEQLRLELTRLWQQMTSSRVRVLSLVEAVDASTLALKGSQRTLAEGLSTAADDASLRSADIDLRRQLAQTRLELIQARLRLQIRAGLPAADAAAGLDALWPMQKPTTEGAAS
jgi:protease secretion system outer membrane protein